nr:hypothetical protein [uncultured Mediterranean phage uvMED]
MIVRLYHSSSEKDSFIDSSPLTQKHNSITLRQMTPFIPNTELQKLSNEERLAYADYVRDYIDENPYDYQMMIDSLFE